MSDTQPIMTPEALEAKLLRAPFHQWLGLKAVSVDEDGITLRATWREEWVVNPDRRYTHGGILAALVDLAADWAIGARLGRGVPTVDMRVDYHRVAMPGDLICRGTVVRMGSQFSVAEARILDLEDRLLASGRGVYLTAPPKA
ncbi:MAG: PaaI family thioesterase [Acetobacteraceae bacterium]|nr:PaaI family thioesterase [Acetobacteraceae bacterium]